MVIPLERKDQTSLARSCPKIPEKDEPSTHRALPFYVEECSGLNYALDTIPTPFLGTLQRLLCMVQGPLWGAEVSRLGMDPWCCELFQQSQTAVPVVWYHCRSSGRAGPLSRAGAGMEAQGLYVASHAVLHMDGRGKPALSPSQWVSGSGGIVEIYFPTAPSMYFSV